MKRLIGTLLCALTFLALLVSLAVPALATPAQAPEWSEGDRWAFGTEADLGEELQTEMEDLANVIDEALNDFEGVEADLDDLSFDGSAGAWSLFEITDANDDTYVLCMKTAAMVSVDAGIAITAELPEEGTYAPDEIMTVDRTNVTMSADLSFDMALTADIDVTFDRDTMAIMSIEATFKLTGALDISAENLPIWLFNMMESEELEMEDITVEYKDYDIKGDLNIDLALGLEFVPALNMWDFPLDMGDEWNVSSNATMTGSLTGSLDVTGLPQDLEDALFEEISELGVDSFPIILEDLEIEDSPFENGEIEESTEHIEFGLSCTDVFTVNDPYWDDITVYEISMDDAPMKFFYSPDVGFMSYLSMNIGDMNEDLPDEEIRMEAVDPDVAEDEISEINDFQGNIGEDDDSGVLGFFTDAPYLGIILVVVIVVVVVAAVFLIRKK